MFNVFNVFNAFDDRFATVFFLYSVLSAFFVFFLFFFFILNIKEGMTPLNPEYNVRKQSNRCKILADADVTREMFLQFFM